MNIINKIQTKTLPKLLLTAMLSASLIACGGGSDNGGSTNTGGTNSGGVNNGGSNTGAVEPVSNDELSINSAVAKNFVDNLATPVFDQFATDSQNLVNATQSYCAALSNGSAAASQRAAAQDAWIKAKNQWQASKIYHVGIVADNHGMLAKKIYNPNLLNNSIINKINQNISKYKNDSNLNIEAQLVYTRGLGAMEYLLFDDAANNVDSCNYTLFLAKDVAKQAETIKTDWQAKRNDLLTTTNSNGVDLVQPFFDNVVTVLDKDLKDTGLGTPLTLKTSGVCPQICAERIENRVSRTSYDNIKASLENLKTVFNGQDDLGFKVYYDNKKMDSEAQAFTSKIDAALATVNAQAGSSLFEQVTQIKANGQVESCKAVASTGVTTDDALAPCKLYYQIKQLSDDVKTGSFKLAVNLAIPDAAAGDGD